ncbi:hypothetical protein M1D49_18525 [Bacillus sp. PK3-056]|uniref:TIGR04104 family putative zinc finger protein n=1 Tax=Niallia circulans TaxID=1397 RepID=UPI000F45EC7B|nr:TIGR04104 family putative zinc finger protein [Niallia circulans]AYV71651.1 hypothetical protein C2H98_08665 [Niallia circulans]
MRTCQNCDQKWTWKQTLKSSFTLDNKLICPHCREKQYVTSRTRGITFMATILIITFTLLSNLLLGPSFVFVVILISFILIVLGLYPFWVELSNKETGS